MIRKVFTALLILAATSAVLLASPYIRYRRSPSIVPPWVRLGGLSVGGVGADEVAAALNRGLDEPVSAYYADTRLLLRPGAVGFKADAESMIAQAQTYDTLDLLVRYLVGESIRRPLPPIEIPVQYAYDANALDAWLRDVAGEHDRPPVPPQPLVQTMDLAPGKPGTRLDVERARAQMVSALSNPTARTVQLAVSETPAPPIDLKALGTLLQARIDEFPGIGSIYLTFLPTGEDVAVEADVAYAGTSTLKIPILAQLYRYLDAPPGVETTKLITETMMHSGNFSANLLLGKLGDGDWDAGVRVMNQSFKTLGLKNTFMAAPYDRKLASPPRIVTAANSRTDKNTAPDPYMQTTPRDIGSMLQMVVACSQGGGTLIAVYGEKITPEECKQALDFMALNEMTELLVGGLPAGTHAVHKHGYVPDTHGDVAAVWGPQGPYVLAVFLYRPTWLEWHISNPTMQEISRTVWNYFDGKLGAQQPPEDTALERLP